MTTSATDVDGRTSEQLMCIPLPRLSEPRIREQVERERERLLRKTRLSMLPESHFKRPREHPFMRQDWQNTTILIGGLSLRHDELIMAGLRGLGYRLARLPTPDKADFQAGKEYGNNGQCNPTYFMVGSLVNYLKYLRDDKGVPTEQILKDYVFITAGSCGPCRFGMYEAEYRLALRNSGFDGFRVLLFDQSSGVGQAAEGGGLEFNVKLFLQLLNSMFIGDLLNEVAYHIRPYEVIPGSTEAVMEECLQLCQQALEEKGRRSIRGGRLTRRLSNRLALSGPDDVALLLDQLRTDRFTSTLRRCVDLLNEKVQVDYTRPKPIVKITGEFWAQTTEGDGNFRMFRFIEGEGGQVLVEPVATWIDYLIFSVIQEYRGRRGLREGERLPSRYDLWGRLRHGWRYRSTLVQLHLVERIIRREYERLRRAMGGTAHMLANQFHLQRLASPYYNSRAEGGEAHMEVAKNIYYANNKLAHMVLSLKPFGCMPSTQSDGAQAAVVGHFPDMIYLPIETSGEGDINAHSRVQMALGEAKIKCKHEFARILDRTGYTLEQIQTYVAEHRELRRPVQNIPHHKGAVGLAANFVTHVAARMRKAGV